MIAPKYPTLLGAFVGFVDGWKKNSTVRNADTDYLVGRRAGRLAYVAVERLKEAVK